MPFYRFRMRAIIGRHRTGCAAKCTMTSLFTGVLWWSGSRRSDCKGTCRPAIGWAALDLLKLERQRAPSGW